ncbi:MAG: hypothetical protein VYD09_03150 [Chloroflexota bacterium]|nr:hypothetical protein [Chloroflexota bacterium]
MLTRSSLYITIITLIIIPFQHTEAQSRPDIEIIATITPSEINIGDTFYLEVLVRHSNAVAVSTNLAMISGIELVGSPIDEFGSLSESFSLTSSIYELQVFNFNIPQQLEIKVLWVSEDGQTGLVNNFVNLPTVIRLVTDASATVRDLKPQQITRSDHGSTVSYRMVFGIVIISLFISAVILYLRRNKLAEIEEPGSEDKARSQLAELHSLKLDEVADLQKFYSTLSRVIRLYLSNRFNLDALTYTSSELNTSMRERGIERWQARLVGELLKRCDLAIYAHIYPDPDSANFDLTLAYEIIEFARVRQR